MDLPRKEERTLTLDLISKLPLIFIVSIRLSISNETFFGIFKIPCCQGFKKYCFGGLWGIGEQEVTKSLFSILTFLKKKENKDLV